MSTANMFALQIFCQYGLGGMASSRFGVWRERAIVAEIFAGASCQEQLKTLSKFKDVGRS